MDYYSHKSIRKLVKALLETFSDIQIERVDKAGNIISHNAVPIVFGSGDRAQIMRKTDLEQLKAGNFNVLPRAGLSIVSMLKATDRNTNRLNQVFTMTNTDGGRDYSMNSVSYDMTFELVFLSRTMNDATAIIETILPRFNPSLMIRYKELDIDIEETSVPLEMDTVELNVMNDFSSGDTRIITTTFYIRAKTNIYHPITNSKLIEQAILRISAVDEDDNKHIDIDIQYPIQNP